MGFFKGAAAVVAGIAVLANLPTRLWMSAEKASLDYLAKTQLSTITKDKNSRRKFEVLPNTFY